MIKTMREPWPGTMTARERFHRQMNHQAVDRCFHWEFGYWLENFTQWAVFHENGVTNNREAETFFGFDDIRWLNAVCWMHPPFPEEEMEVSGDYRIIRNKDGLLAEVPKDGHDTIPHFLKSSITTPDDWGRVKAERFQRDDPARRLDVEALKKTHPADHPYVLMIQGGSLIGRIRDMLTVEGLAYACYDYPEMVEDMVETACVLIEDFFDQVLTHIAIDGVWGWEDICFRSGPLVTMDFFREVLIPRYRRLGTKLRAANVDLWLTDCDGDVRPLVPDWLEVGLNIMFPYEVQCSGHPSELLNQYGPALRIWGGVDKMQLLKGREAIKSYLKTLAPLVEQGGFIPGCDHRCPPDVREEDYLYYLDLKREMFGIT